VVDVIGLMIHHMQVLSSHPDVAECAVIGAEDQLKGEVPVGFIVLKVRLGPHASLLTVSVTLSTS
jgi:propionyl-CoA synthetase